MMTDFLHDERGAVTVDWVLLTAAMVGLALSVMAVIADGSEELTGEIETQLEQPHTRPRF